jgi:hypothetical protein
VPGNIYSRIMNPTCDSLELRIAAMGGGWVCRISAMSLPLIEALRQTGVFFFMWQDFIENALVQHIVFRGAKIEHKMLSLRAVFLATPEP